ncbi:MAG: hypothetical protein ABIH79_02995 [archaeon]
MGIRKNSKHRIYLTSLTSLSHIHTFFKESIFKKLNKSRFLLI